MKTFSPIFIFSLLFSMIASLPALADEIRLSHSHSADDSSEIYTAAKIFKEYMEGQQTQVSVRIFSKNALGSEREVYESMQMGSGADCAITGTAILGNFCSQLAVLDLPYLWRDYDHVHQVLDGPVGQKLADELETEGFKVLAWMDSWGYRNIVAANRKMESLNDLKGLKIRTIASPVYIRALRLLGCNPTPMSFGEVYSGMQTGVIDGFEHSASVIRAEKFYEAARNMAITRHIFGPLVFCYSKSRWDRLRPDVQELVMAAARVARDEQRRLAPIRENEALSALKEKMTVHSIDTSSLTNQAKILQDQIAEERGAVEILAMIRAAY